MAAALDELFSQHRLDHRRHFPGDDGGALGILVAIWLKARRWHTVKQVAATCRMVPCDALNRGAVSLDVIPVGKRRATAAQYHLCASGFDTRHDL